jgi:hypothetical protein
MSAAQNEYEPNYNILHTNWIVKTILK